MPIVGTVGLHVAGAGDRPSVDFRSDQFALGSIAYEMLTGRRAFKRDTPVQTMAAVVDSEPSPLGRARRPDAPQELVTVVNRCLPKDPTGRYASTRIWPAILRDVHSGLDVVDPLEWQRRPSASRRSGVAGWRVVAVVALA